MKNIIKKALTEWFDNLFTFDFGFNFFAILLTLASLVCEVIFACYSTNLANIIFNPFVVLLLVGFGYYGYQIIGLISKYYEIEMEKL